MVRILNIINTKSPIIKTIIQNISKKTFLIQQIISYNSFKDETKILLHHVKFQNEIDNIMFHFTIPEGVDVLQLDAS